MDWDNLKVLKSSTIDLSTPKHDWSLSVAEVCAISQEEVKCEERHSIAYYMLEDQKKEFKGVHDEDCPVYGVSPDGEHLIIGNGDEVVLLESMTERSTAHLIADVKVNDFVKAGVGMNEKGQLMVCNDTVIKVFEYNCNPTTLMALCRYNIRKNTPNDYRSWVNTLAIPQVLKDYLLYEQVQPT